MRSEYQDPPRRANPALRFIIERGTVSDILARRRERGMKITSRQIKAVVSIAFLAMLFGIVRKGEFAALFRRIDPLYFVLSFVIAAAQISTSCLKWQVLVNLYQQQKASFGFLMKNYLIGYYFTNLLPSNVGGDVVRSYYAGRHIGSQTHAAISVFIERFTGMMYLLFLVVVAPLFRSGLYPRLSIVIPALGGVALLVAFVWMARMERPLAKIVDVIIRVLRFFRSMGGPFGSALAVKMIDRLEGFCHRLLKKAESIHEKLTLTVNCLKQDWKAFLAVLVLTVLFYALTWVNVKWAFRTFGVSVSLVDIAALLPTAMIVGSIPITLGSLGIVEGSYVFYFRLVGVDPAATLAMGLFLRFKLIVVGIIGFLIYLTYPHEKYDYERFRGQAE